MGSLVDTVMAHIGDPQLAQIAGQLGTSPDQARAAIEHALPLIVGGMAQNASTPQGADALHNALGGSHGLSGPNRLPRSATSSPRACNASAIPATRNASGPIDAPRAPAPISVGAPIRETGGKLRMRGNSGN